MGRIIARLVGGPLDGRLFSVTNDQEEIGGLEIPGYEPMQLLVESVDTGEVDGEGQPVMKDHVTGYKDKYVKRAESLRSFVGEEEELAAAAFDHKVEAICEFHYADS